MAAVKALVERENRFLALKVDVGGEEMWTLPGGRVELGEAPLEALRREIREEVSLEVDLKGPVGMYHFFITDDKQVVLTVYAAEIVSGEVDIESNPADEPIEGFEWVTPEEFVSRNINENLANLVRENYGLD